MHDPELASVRHLGERRRFDGCRHIRRNRLDRRQRRDLGRSVFADEFGKEIDGVSDDVGFVIQRRGDVDRAVGDQEELVISGVIEHKDVA